MRTSGNYKTIKTEPVQICWFWLRSVKKAWQTTRQLPPHIDSALLVAHILDNGYNKKPQNTQQLPPHIEIASLFAHIIDSGCNKVSQNTQQLPPHIAIALLFTHIFATGSWVVAGFYSIHFKETDLLEKHNYPTTQRETICKNTHRSLLEG